MGVLLHNSQLNWLPKSAVFFQLVDDIIDLNGKINDQWIKEEFLTIKEVKLYALDLRNKNCNEVSAFLETIELLLNDYKNASNITEFYDGTTYQMLLAELATSLKQQILSLDKL